MLDIQSENRSLGCRLSFIFSESIHGVLTKCQVKIQSVNAIKIYIITAYSNRERANNIPKKLLIYVRW
jgi:hypothetical protein